MPKTKTLTRTKLKSKIKTAAEPTIVKLDKKDCCSMACDTSCYLCSIFKVMIALFIIMIIFWIGACFGSLGAKRSFNNVYRPMSVNRLPNLNKATKMCADAPADQLASKINSVLSNKKGNEFDKEFLLEMTLNHQATLDMAKLALTKSTREDIKKLAQQIIDNQTKEIQTMKVWQTDWFKAK